MRLHVHHETVYQYAAPVGYAIQAMRLTPRPHEGLTVLSWRVRGDGGRDLPSIVDGYGNVVHTQTITVSHTGATIIAEGDVETRDTAGVLRGASEPLPPGLFLKPTLLTAIEPEIEALAEAARGQESLDTLHRLMNVVRNRLDYKLGETEVETTAAEALKRGVGVCQDHAHVFIAAARAGGIPARYVGGYLWTGEDARDFEANHAWVEAYVEDLGWVGFDPSNRVCPTEAYIRTAVGLDYRSALPICGVRRGLTNESLAVTVRVAETGAEQ
jgi:transglutaminase-like putative cysteine protease